MVRPVAYDVRVVDFYQGRRLETFRRCGRVFTREPQRVEAESLTADQLRELLGTPTLEVVPVEVASPPPPPPPEDPKAKKR